MYTFLLGELMTEQINRKKPIGATAYERNLHDCTDAVSFDQQLKWFDRVDELREKKKAEQEAASDNIFSRALLSLFGKK